jgi:hypothetical protein
MIFGRRLGICGDRRAAEALVFALGPCQPGPQRVPEILRAQTQRIRPSGTWLCRPASSRQGSVGVEQVYVKRVPLGQESRFILKARPSRPTDNAITISTPGCVSAERFEAALGATLRASPVADHEGRRSRFRDSSLAQIKAARVHARRLA